jgi:hypothetical protein
MQNLTLADIQRALSPSSTLTPSEKTEVLRLLAQLEQVAEAEAFEDPRCPMGDYLMEFGGAQPVARRPVSWPAGERPPIAEFIAAFAPVMPVKPKPETKPVIASTPDIATRVPPGRRGKLLDDVLQRTTEEMRRASQATDDVDRLRPYRGIGRLDLDGAGGYSDE